MVDTPPRVRGCRALFDGRRVLARALWLALLLSGLPASGHIDRVFACFVYLEPYEIRVEFVTSSDSLGVSDEVHEGGIDQAEQAHILEDMQSRLLGAFEVRADDELLRFTPERCAFVKIDPDRGAIEDRRDVIPGNWARISGMFVCPIQSLPEAVEVRLKMYEDPSYRPPTRIPLQIEVLASPGQRETARFYLNKGFPDQYWALPAGLSHDTRLAQTPATEHASYTPMWVAGALGVAGLGLIVLPVFRASARVALGSGLVVTGLVVGVLGVSRGFAVPVDEAEAQQTIQSLLANVYRAFAYRDESKAFDRLATSVAGPLREQLYLDIRRGIADAEDGGPSVRVLAVEVVDCVLEESNSQRLRARVRWVSRGSVSHWGHAHDRANQYNAEVVAEPVDGRWRLTGVRILEERRVE
ncbi:MAG: hypothetical protein ACE37H_12395 [Phycisphaeraceae bacterium]